MQYFGADCFMGTSERFINSYKILHHALSALIESFKFAIYRHYGIL